MPTWISKVWNWTKTAGRAWKSAPSRIVDETMLGRGVWNNSVLGGLTTLGSYGAGRVVGGAAIGGIVGGFAADSNTQGGVMRGVASGALLGAGAGLLTTGGFWSVAHDVAGRPAMRMARGAANRFVGNPIGVFKAGRIAGQGNRRAGAGATWASLKKSFGRVVRPVSSLGKLSRGAIGFTTRHPNLVGGGVALGAMYSMWGGVATGEERPRTSMQYAIAEAGPYLPQPSPVREHYQILQSSTEGLVQGLHVGRHR